MKLKSVSYTQDSAQDQEWKLETMALGQVNLLVGRNATGKTKTLNMINNLARLLSGAMKLIFTSGDHKAVLEEEGRLMEYSLSYRDTKVTLENFVVDGRTLLERGPNGVGRIYAEKENKNIDFQTPDNELAVVARRDSIQHPFFEPLYQWASQVRHYAFGSDLGKTFLAVLVKDQKVELDTRDTNLVVAVFRAGERDFGQAFKDAIRNDMACLGYPIEEIGTRTPISLVVRGLLPGPVVCLYVKESDLKGVTDQNDMSQGMWRALSVIVHINYSELARRPSCILIDDIGEGLDFERSCAIIKLLMRKAKESSVQLVMATNDRFVMNAVPLEAWTVLGRQGPVCHVYNYLNSQKTFDDFKLTGLNNFDFFATNFLDEADKS